LRTCAALILLTLTSVTGKPTALKATIQTTYGNGAATAETDLVKAIADGTLDGGVPSPRAFGRAGLHGLEPSEAPLLITSYAAEKTIVSGPAGQALLHILDSTKVIGLGLAVGPLRRPFATNAPLTTPDAWRGTTVRSFNSDTRTPPSALSAACRSTPATTTPT
jgi:TRAP-type C4-dicarboxylate transport system substrate-binding protein